MTLREPVQWVERLDDSRLDAYRDLRRVAAGSPEGCFIAEGRTVVQRLLHSDYRVTSILTCVDCLDWLDGQPIPAGTPVLRMSKTRLCELVGYDFHRGIMACGVRKGASGKNRFPAAGPEQTMIGLCNVTDPENVGAIIRTATAFGVKDVLLDRTCADPLSRRVLRVSMGTALQQRFWFYDDWTAALPELVDRHGCRVIATTLSPQAQSIGALAHDRSPYLVLLGNEGHGLPTPVQALATDAVTIPIQATNSLNVAAAAAVVLYELSGRGAVAPLDP
ncbi:TrmH family RNA methyltransferase [Roseimaritima sediminicola]|uniref:TrmH family RNA methyltransferase n=1 Tax=Roseimaritima sediminicola TaxID=2662066 RepID=UPI00129848CE|nr:RNA methyltransferase [Roseimaritima sediminicola]